MARKSTRPNAKQQPESDPQIVDLDADALSLFWAMFYFRLLLFSALVLFVVFAAIDTVITIWQPDRLTVFNGQPLQWAFWGVFGVAGLRIVALLCYDFVPPLGGLILTLFDYTLVPLLAFIRDVFVETPRIFAARVLECLLDRRHTIRDNLLPVILPLMLCCAVFAASWIFGKPLFLTEDAATPTTTQTPQHSQ